MHEGDVGLIDLRDLTCKYIACYKRVVLKSDCWGNCSCLYVFKAIGYINNRFPLMFYPCELISSHYVEMIK